MGTQVVIRADASLSLGSGHVTRCLTLAETLRSQGASVEFICQDSKGNLIDYICENGFCVHPLKMIAEKAYHGYHSGIQANVTSNWREDANAVATILKKFQSVVDWLVVDHYALDQRWENQLRSLVRKIMVIDDLENRNHDCDLLLDQNFSTRARRYDRLIPKHCITLLGPNYALLREEFSKARQRLRSRTGKINRILISFGGSDPTNETVKILKGICLCNHSNLEIQVVIGLQNPHEKSIKKQAGRMLNVTCHRHTTRMVELMEWADLFIGTGGTTTWERCCLGLPSLVVATAENQEKIIHEMALEGFILFVGKSSDVKASTIADHLKCLSINPYLIQALSKKSVTVSDGQGVFKIVQRLQCLTRTHT